MLDPYLRYVHLCHDQVGLVVREVHRVEIVNRLPYRFTNSGAIAHNRNYQKGQKAIIIIMAVTVVAV